MKKTRIIMTLSAFVLAIAGATASSFLNPPEQGIFGFNYLGCFTAPSTIEAGCGNGGTYQCYVIVPGTGAQAPAYSLRINVAQCVRPLRRF